MSNKTSWAGIAQSVLRLATDWMAWGSNPGRGEIFRTRLDWATQPPMQWAPCPFPGVKAAGTWR